VTVPPKAARPYLQEIDAAADPGLAPQVPDILPEGQAMQTLARLGQSNASALTRFALWAFGSLFLFVLSVAAWDFVTGLFTRNLILGWIAFGLVALALLAALILAVREWAAFARLARLDGLRAAAEAAHAAADLPAARRMVADLTRLYSARPDTAWSRARLAEREAEVMDADALLALAERELMTPLDARARAAVESAARQVATVTALVPMALADVAASLVANLRMIRQIAEIYGGRSGSLGNLRLLRRVFTSLLAAGALALTDDMIGSVAGGGVLSRLSRRFGEGVVNGALTARVGVAAIELCRPLPFRALDRPAVSSLVSRALAGVLGSGQRKDGP
jgi:putative membrane protein